MRSGRIDSRGEPIGSFAMALSHAAGRMVVDKTGLTGKYDIALTWMPDEQQADVPGPSIFTALKEQLGLKLVPGKEAVDTLIVDHLEAPSEN
jgi:uncharacterized protein (TIGR03435 family)